MPVPHCPFWALQGFHCPAKLKTMGDKGDWRRFVVENKDLCARCGGLCCKSYPGMYLDPGQFMEAWDLEPTRGSLRELFSRYPLEMRVCMGVPIPRPRVTEGGCVFLGIQGCLLPREKRPLECLALVPREETLVEGEILCQRPRDLRYVRCFQEWKGFYLDHGLWKEAWDLVEEGVDREGAPLVKDLP